LHKARDTWVGLEKWQIAVLALLALAVVGAYLLLANMIGSRIHAKPVARTLDLIAPLDGTVVQVGNSITVEALASGSDLNRLEVWSDDAPLFVSSRSMPAGEDPWTVSGQWVVGWPGAHRLFVRGFTTSGEMIVSRSVTAPAAPEGRLLFASKRDGRYAIYRSRLDGGELERLFIGEGDSREPSVNRAGQLLLTQILAGQHRGLWQVDLETHSAGVLMDDAANLSQAVWAPDGEMLAYVSNRSGSDQVWITRVDAGAGQALTDEPVSASQPTWNAGGTYLAYTARRSDNLDIFRVRSDGQELRQLTNESSVDWQPAWSPVADQIAFVSNRSGEYQIHVMEADGSNPRQITDLIGGAEQPRWSPDGGWIAFVGYSGEGEGLAAREIYLVRANGRDPMRLTHNAFDDTEPVWAWPETSLSAGGPASPGMSSGAPFVGAYFDNMTLSGEPAMQREDAWIAFDWGLGSPGAALSSDHFSVRWSGELHLEQAGDYLFDLRVDDGARLWIDGVLVIDRWGQSGLSEASAPVRLEQGLHTLRLEYYENEGPALASLSWRLVP
jgi:tricorn protease-like protein